MGEVSSGAAGLVVGGVGTLLAITFTVALRMFVMADKKDDASYDRLQLELATVRREREAEQARFRTELEAARREAAEWRERYLTEISKG